MQAALEHISQRYRVSGDALPRFSKPPRQVDGAQPGPLLIVAIIGIESGFNRLPRVQWARKV
jgi:hypothetical protein